MFLRDFFEYLVEHPGAARLLGIIVLAIICAPLIFIWARAKQVTRIHRAYTGLINEQSEKIAKLYRNFTDVHEELAKARGELAMKVGELAAADSELARRIREIQELNERIKSIEERERELIEKLKQYEDL